MKKIKRIRALEGNTQLLDGGAMFGNAPKEMWKKWMEVDALNRIKLSCRSLFIQTSDDKNILFETGIGTFFDPKLKERYGVLENEHVLLNSLKEIGLTHEQIDYVILSHLHFDHAGGLLTPFEEGEAKLLFPNAKYLVSKEQWLRATNPHSRDRASYVPTLNQLLEKSNRLVLVEDDKGKNTFAKNEFKDLITFRYSNGHTLGLMLSEIHLDDGPLVFVSDLIPGFAWVHVPISMGYDRFAELIIDEKKELLDDLIQRNGKLFFTHDPNHAFGKLCRDEKGKYFAQEFSYSPATTAP